MSRLPDPPTPEELRDSVDTFVDAYLHGRRPSYVGLDLAARGTRDRTVRVRGRIHGARADLMIVDEVEELTPC